MTPIPIRVNMLALRSTTERHARCREIGHPAQNTTAVPNPN